MKSRPPPLKSDKYNNVGKAEKKGNHILMTILGRKFIFNISMVYALLQNNYDEVYIYEERVGLKQEKLVK